MKRISFFGSYDKQSTAQISKMYFVNIYKKLEFNSRIFLQTSLLLSLDQEVSFEKFQFEIIEIKNIIKSPKT